MTNQAFCSQQGVALVVGLIFLLLMTVIGVSSIQTTTLDERMAGNANDRNIAFQAAESGLRRAEALIDKSTNKYDFQDQFVRSDTPGIYDSWTINLLDRIHSAGNDLNVSEPPAYVIQCLHDCASGWYRVTARAQGITSTSVVILESIILSRHSGSILE